MDTGLDFLRDQVNNAVMQHDAFVRSLADHESQAEDQRYRDLCARHVPRMREHQRMLEEYQQQLGQQLGSAGTQSQNVAQNVAENVAGTVKRLAGQALAAAKDLADAPPQSDFVRLAGDIVMGRQAEDTFKTFREAGRTLGIPRLANIGEVGERGMDGYVKDANRLVQQLFVERARGAEFSNQARASTAPPLGG